MPHVNIKHFPVELSAEDRDRLVASITDAVSAALRCRPGAISIALEPIEQERWQEVVYGPEITDRKDLLCKTPDY